ncbi:unnamed protein product [Pieris macdunnoughi]|uniref:Uncharacterized protein n=1 Tax=Pieris macdunnoughi TaxID=345717 RepID=A0A821XZP6_9NEOP|nr:unnamed protein product [Pieris macdunnoughi]
MYDLELFVEQYLPYFGHALMALGYILEEIDSFQPPVPSAVVLIGHLCVLTDPRTLTTEQESVRILNIIFLISNLLVFVYDFVLALEFNMPPINELDQYMG